MKVKLTGIEEFADRFNQILKHCKKCKVCRVRMEHLLQCAIEKGDYKDEE